MSPKTKVTPHVRELLAETVTPLAVYQRLLALSPTRFLLESVTSGEQVARWSFLGAGPREIVRVYADLTCAHFSSPGSIGRALCARAG